MENLFDFLENKSKEEKQENIILETQTIDISTTQKTKYIIDEEHLKHLEKVKISLYNEDEIKASGLERKDYIRLNSYVGSRLNTDLRAKNNPIKEVEVKIELVEENYLDSLEEVEMDELTICKNRRTKRICIYKINEISRWRIYKWNIYVL